MNGAFYVGSVGLEAQQRALDLIANNVANMNTPAFKRADVRFSEIVASQPATASSDAERRTEAGPFVAGGVASEPRFAVLEQGPMEVTGNAFDIALEGRGFIELMGPEGRALLWRGGRLKINDDGLLATAEGLPLRAGVTIPDDVTALEIGRDGIVSGTAAGSQERIEFGRIELVGVDDPSGLTRLDGGLYRVADDLRVSAGAPGEDGMGLLLQGSIERSNVELTTEMVRMMMVQRAYSANAQVVQAADQLSAIVNNLRG